MQERVFCSVPKGGTISYEGGLSRVKGVLHVEVKKDAGEAKSVYTLDVESADPYSG